MTRVGGSSRSINRKTSLEPSAKADPEDEGSVQPWNDIADGAKDVASKAKDAAKSSPDAANEAIEDTVDAAGKKAKSAPDVANDAIEDAVDSTGKASKDAVDAAKSAAGVAKDAVRDTAEKISDKVKSIADSPKEELDSTAPESKTKEASEASSDASSSVAVKKDTWDADNKHEQWYLDSDDKTARYHMDADLKLPEQGYHGQPVKHVDNETGTADWQNERHVDLDKICARYPNLTWCKRRKEMSEHAARGDSDSHDDKHGSKEDKEEDESFPWKKHLRPFSGTTGTTACSCVTLLVFMAGVVLS